MPRASSVAPKHPRGFSLFELLAVVSIVAMAAVALSQTMLHRPTQGLETRATVEQLASLLREARHHARATRRPVTLTLDASGSNSVSAMQLSVRSTPTEELWTVDWPSIPIQDWPQALRFDERGRAESSVDAVIGIPHHAYRIRMYAASGIVRIQRP